MRRPGRHRLIFAAGLLTIAVLYTAYSLYVLNPDVYVATSRRTRHFYKFGAVLLVYGIGLLTYSRFAAAWLVQLWHILYAGGLALLLLLALYDAWVSEIPPAIRDVISNFHEFLICPIPYVIAGILGRPSRHRDIPQ